MATTYPRRSGMTPITYGQIGYPGSTTPPPLTTAQIGRGGTGSPIHLSGTGLGYWHPPGWVDPNAPTIVPGGPAPGPSPLNDVPSALQTASLVNTTNLDFVRHGQQSDPVYAMIQNLLDPNWGPQAYDSAQASAEDAFARGISGSNLANFRGARTYANDLKENAALAGNLLSGATGRLPGLYNTGANITSPAEAERLQLERDRLEQQAILQREAEAAAYARALLAQAGGYRGGGGGYGGGGAGRGASVAGVSGEYAPTLGTFNQTDNGPGVYYPPAGQDTTNYPFDVDYGSLNPSGDWMASTDWQDTGNQDDWWNQPLTMDNSEDFYQ